MSNAALRLTSRDMVQCKNKRMPSGALRFGKFSNNEGLARTAKMTSIDAKLLLRSWPKGRIEGLFRHSDVVDVVDVVGRGTDI
ncbi:hypothetical protein [Paraburkholderia sediminicola]|uniref:hypothetical protein n=1 Tax=Paraburkholderia sediminicola TaxID=458836 RepID=UPI0038BCF50E